MTTNIEIARKIAEVNCPLSRESVHALAEIVAVSYTHLTLPTT